MLKRERERERREGEEKAGISRETAVCPVVAAVVAAFVKTIIYTRILALNERS